MSERLEIRLENAENTLSTGESFAQTLYGPVDVHLVGEVGAGKTTFLQGFARGLGIPHFVNSPTFALEQRASTAEGIPFLHIDCYRLSPAQADGLLHQTDDHQGIRCIEWADRAPHADGRAIRIQLEDDDTGGRKLICMFDDHPLPTDDDVQRWLDAAATPQNVRDHSNVVADVAVECARDLVRRGIVVRTEAVRLVAQLHDIFRYLDFSALPPDLSPAVRAQWDAVRRQYPGQRHEAACATFLRDEGFAMLGSIVAVHGLTVPAPPRPTIEQQLVFYADKRVAFDRIVTVQERFDDFRKRYGGDRPDEEAVWLGEVLAVERRLFPEGVPV